MKTYNAEILIAIPIVLVVLVVPALLLIGCFGSKNSQRKRQKFRDPAESSGTILRIWKTTDYQPEGPYYEPWWWNILTMPAASCMKKVFKQITER